MKFIIGLGNPAPQYTYTRHNIGFLLIERAITHWKLRLQPGKGDFYEAILQLEDEIHFVQPTTYVNLSGIAVKQLVDLYHPSLDRLLVVVDDFNLPFGRLKLKPTGGAGGHNGLKSIICALGTEDFPRLKMGIGPLVGDPADYVLGEFTHNERDRLPEFLNLGLNCLEYFIKFDLERAISYCNSFCGTLNPKP